eukprot:17831-Heterococcus_DN1.PRE.1
MESATIAMMYIERRKQCALCVATVATAAAAHSVHSCTQLYTVAVFSFECIVRAARAIDAQHASSNAQNTAICCRCHCRCAVVLLLYVVPALLVPQQCHYC